MKQVLDTEIIDNIAIGLGPSNLSLAALAYNIPQLKIHFIEKKHSFSWYEGAILNSSFVQSSIIRDLVTLVDPSNPFSFLSYLHQEKKIYSFMSANFSSIPAYEFNSYYKWAANKLDDVSYGEWVNEVRFDNGLFSVHTSKRIIKAKNLILGTGKIPYYPEHSILNINDNSFHGTMYAKKAPSTFANKTVTIVGNNQNAAEVFEDLISRKEYRPSAVTWLLEDLSLNAEVGSPFDSELFFPYCHELFQSIENFSLIASHDKAHLLNGISKATLKNIYINLYRIRHSRSDNVEAKILVNTVINAQDESNDVFNLVVYNKLTKKPATLVTDNIIYCTGLEHKIPEFLNPIKSMLEFNEKGISLDENQCAKLNKNISNKIFIHNGLTSSKQVNNQHLALVAYYSAKVINNLLGYNAYDLSTEQTIINWDTT